MPRPRRSSGQPKIRRGRWSRVGYRLHQWLAAAFLALFVGATVAPAAVALAVPSPSASSTEAPVEEEEVAVVEAIAVRHELETQARAPRVPHVARPPSPRPTTKTPRAPPAEATAPARTQLKTRLRLHV